MSLTPPTKDDKKPTTAIVESGKNYPEGQPKDETIRFYEVICPKCRARPGYPCTFGEANTPQGKKVILDVFSIHIMRVLAYEAYMRGELNELAIDRKGHPVRGGMPE